MTKGLKCYDLCPSDFKGLLIFPFSGSGRVTFNNQRSYLKAVSAAFVEIKTPKFTKKVHNTTTSIALVKVCIFILKAMNT